MEDVVKIAKLEVAKYTNQIMVVLVTASPVFPSGKLFVKELVEEKYKEKYADKNKYLHVRGEAL